jgi:predicted permease
MLTRFLCRLLLLAFPARFRDQRGRALVQTLVDDSRDASGRLSPPRFAAGALDVIRAGLSERITPAPSTLAAPAASTSSSNASWYGDLKSAWRSIRHRPAASITIVGTLALGLGATTAMFTVVDAVLLRPLPYPDDRALVLFGERDPVRRLTGVSIPAMADLTAFPELSSVGGYESESRLFKERGEPERITGATVSPGFFRTLGVAPALGRTLPADGPLLDPDPKMVLGHDLWLTRFGADASVVGRLITLEGKPYTVVGVMPPGFEFPAGANFWTTLPMEMRMLSTAPSVRVLDVVGRLAPGATVAALDQRVREWSARTASMPEARSADWKPYTVTLREDVLGAVDVALVIVFGGVCLLLGVACANVASLMLAAGRSRLRDYAVQTALGAGRARLVRQIVCEGLLLALAGSSAALLVAAATRHAIIALSVDQIPRIETMTVGIRGSLFALAAAMVTTLLITAAPAVLLTRRASLDLRQHASRTAAGSRSSRRIFGGLVAVEFALALMLVVGSGLLFTTYRRLQTVETGLRPSQVLLAHLSIPLTPEWTRTATSGLYEGLLSTLRRGEITDVALTLRRPLEAARGGTEVWATESPDTKIASLQHSTSEGYFGAIGGQFIAGRDFDRSDRAGAPPVVIVNDRTASALWPGADPIGRTLTIPHYRGPIVATVVGVVRAIRHDGLRNELRPELYVPFRQTAFPPENLVVRTSGDPRAAVQQIRATLAQLDSSRNVTIDQIATLEENLARNVAQPRFYLVLFGVFAGIALALAALGISGVMSYWLNERWREMGIRVALGGSRASLVRLTVTRGLTMAAAGLVAGLALTLAGGRLIQSLLFDVAPADPTILLAALTVLTVLAAAACAVPARRAALVDPVATLRSE